MSLAKPAVRRTMSAPVSVGPERRGPGGHMTNGSERRVAIACQGGGSHTAFTAGVLGRLLSADELDEYRVVGLSGTSGGAVCALLAWSALLDGDRRDARERLGGFWGGHSPSPPMEGAGNAWMGGGAPPQGTGPLPA